MKTIRFWAMGIMAIMAVSCVTQKQLTYMHDAGPAMADSINRQFTPQSEAIIRSGDALTIFVSAIDQEAVTPYNLPTVVYAMPGTEQVQTTPMMQYYIVDEAGNIAFPVLGEIHVAGLKRTEVAELIKNRLAAQVVDPLVQVNMVGAKVSVLGEVVRPGQVQMNTGRLTILEALAAAGDMTPYGRRDDVLVTRELNGKMQMARLNLRNADIINSPYYYLQPNDVIYVSPNKVRAIGSTNASLWLSMVGTVASAATVIVTVVNSVK